MSWRVKPPKLKGGKIMTYRKFFKGVNGITQKLYKVSKGILKLILALLLWIAIGILNAFISTIFDISVDTVLKMEVGIGLIGMALYLAFMMSKFLEEAKGSKLASIMFAILFKWLGPICMAWVGICIMLN